MRVILGSCFTVLLATIVVAVDCDDLPDSATGFLNHEHVPWTRWRVAGVRTNQSSVPGADRSGGQGHAGGSMSKLRVAITRKRLPGSFAIQGTCVAVNQ